MIEYKAYLREVRLVAEPTSIPKAKIMRSSECDEYIRRVYSDDMGLFESVYLLLLNRGNVTIGFVKVSQGGITSSVVDVRLIAKYAISALATSVVLFHNHPSGNLQPSKDDDRMTEAVRKGLALLDIKLLDHLILTEDGYWSYGDNGRLETCGSL
jgi:DNA repair protein RadC